MIDRVLVDTHLLLRAAREPDRLSAEAREVLDAPSAQPVLSGASTWEIAIKLSLGRPDFRLDLSDLLTGQGRHGWGELAITSADAERVRSLPLLHRDPFDRMLVAQSLVEGIPLVTHERSVAAYEADV